MLKYILLLCLLASSSGKSTQKTFYITNSKTGKVLEAAGKCKDKENNVKVTTKKTGNPKQLWSYGAHDSIINMGQCGRVMDLDHGKCEAGRNIKTWRRTNGGAQKFKFSGPIIYNTSKYLLLNAIKSQTNCSSVLFHFVLTITITCLLFFLK